MSKIYWAVVSTPLEPADGECVDWLVKDEAHGRMVIARAAAAAAATGAAAPREAKLRYQTLRSLPRGVLLEIELFTGRKHQIRVQLAARGSPIVGDKKYGSRDTLARGIALHGRRLSLTHPVRGEQMEFTAPLPTAWSGWGIQDP